MRENQHHVKTVQGSEQGDVFMGKQQQIVWSQIRTTGSGGQGWGDKGETFLTAFPQTYRPSQTGSVMRGLGREAQQMMSLETFNKAEAARQSCQCDSHYSEQTMIKSPTGVLKGLMQEEFKSILITNF